MRHRHTTPSSAPRLDSLEKARQTLLERTAPKSSCLLCTVDENRDNHHSGRCPQFPDPISKTTQATKLNLYLLCLKTAHEDICGVKCGSCCLGHNFLLCSSKRPQPPTKRPYKKEALSQRRHHHQQATSRHQYTCTKLNSQVTVSNPLSTQRQPTTHATPQNSATVEPYEGKDLSKQNLFRKLLLCAVVAHASIIDPDYV
ncbi:hypothetical protein RB195_023040 [Necator americanus]|uniref:Uncharacterized protein n=1 Tax=Necator americanus TaxID=51031 RepID=A0ABR1EHT6_NECAM